jgi:hypothetical protein
MCHRVVRGARSERYASRLSSERVVQEAVERRQYGIPIGALLGREEAAPLQAVEVVIVQLDGIAPQTLASALSCEAHAFGGSRARAGISGHHLHQRVTRNEIRRNVPVADPALCATALPLLAGGLKGRR